MFLLRIRRPPSTTRTDTLFPHTRRSRSHHHMAMNVWNSRGAGRRQRTLGLGRVDIVLPGSDDLGELGERMAHFGVPTRDDGRTVEFRSEEHTSDLQSLMRISYAALSLNKKTHASTQQHTALTVHPT